MNLVDSSAWLEYFGDGPNASVFADAIQEPGKLVVPTVSILEVFRRVREQAGHDDALQAVAAMQQGRVVNLDSSTALHAAKLGMEHDLSLARSVILATARRSGAVLWTQDPGFDWLPSAK